MDGGKERRLFCLPFECYANDGGLPHEQMNTRRGLRELGQIIL